MTFNFRPYLPQDRSDCISVFRSNIPKFFREHELADYETFIDSSGCPYFVIERLNKTVGCGGYGMGDGSDTAILCWGMVASDDHGKRLGEYLLLARLNEIVKHEDVHGVRLATSQYTNGFFERYGFTIQERQRDGFADGLDNVEMRLDLTEDARHTIAKRWNSIVQ